MIVPQIAYINLYSYAAPVAGAALKRSWRTHDGRLFSAFIFINTASEIASYIMSRHGMNNLWVGHIDTLLVFPVIMMIFAGWEKNQSIKKLLWVSNVLYILFWFSMQFTFEPLSMPPQYIGTISSVVFTAIALRRIYTLLSGGESPRLFVDASFWWTCGILLNYAGNFFLFLFEHEIFSLNIPGAGAFWTLHWYLSTAFNVLLTISCLCLKTK